MINDRMEGHVIYTSCKLVGTLAKATIPVLIKNIYQTSCYPGKAIPNRPSLERKSHTVVFAPSFVGI